jgi:hypothetical protein
MILHVKLYQDQSLQKTKDKTEKIDGQIRKDKLPDRQIYTDIQI